MIPGMCPRPWSGLKSVEFVDVSYVTAGEESETIDMPEYARAGDLAILADLNYSDDVSTAAGVLQIPDDFTLIADVTPNSHLAISGKVLDGTETALLGMTHFEFMSKALYIFRGNRPFGGFVVRNPVAINDTGNPSALTIDRVQVASRVSMAFGYMRNLATGTNDGIQTDTVDPAMTRVASASLQTMMFYKIYVPGVEPVSHVLDMGDEGSNNYMAGAFLELY